MTSSNNTPQDWSKLNDKYAKAIYEAIYKFASSEGLPPPQSKIKGETENHMEERMVGVYGKSPRSTSKALVYFYGDGMKLRGNRGGEIQFPVSHESHYGAARGPALLFGMIAEDASMVDTMTRVWMADYAAFTLLSNPKMTNYASPCARLLDGADQRPQLISTMQWLAGKSIHPPKTLSYAPDWLGLYALTLIDKSSREQWARNWPKIRESIVNAKPSDILPLKFPLTVERSTSGHLAYFDNSFPMKDGSAKWAMMEYGNPVVEYGVSDPTVKHSLKNVKLKFIAEVPKCPGIVNEVFKFPTI